MTHSTLNLPQFIWIGILGLRSIEVVAPGKCLSGQRGVDRGSVWPVDIRCQLKQIWHYMPVEAKLTLYASWSKDFFRKDLSLHFAHSHRWNQDWHLPGPKQLQWNKIQTLWTSKLAEHEGRLGWWEWDEQRGVGGVWRCVQQLDRVVSPGGNVPTSDPPPIFYFARLVLFLSLCSLSSQEANIAAFGILFYVVTVVVTFQHRFSTLIWS